MRNIPTGLVKDKTYCVNYLVYKDESGDLAYLYIATRQDKMNDFQNALKNGNFDAEDYGIILEQGTGEASDDVKQKMKVMYNCDHSSNISTLEYTPEAEAGTK
jgi:hypothetical protein